MTILYTMTDPLSSMQRSIKEGHPGTYSFILDSRFILLALILCSGVLCLPAAGYPISAYISTEPQSAPRMTAAEYESQGMALMNEADWSGLLSRADEGLELYPDNAELHCLKGYGLRMTGNYREAVDNITFAIARDPKPIRYTNRGFAYLALERYDEALNDADTAIYMNSSYPRAYDVKAIALMGNGNATGAGQEIETAIRLDPSDPLSWHLKGKISAASGNCSGAFDALNRSLAINPGYILPWPGFENATTDLRRAESQCKPTDQGPGQTKAPLPVGITIAALVIVITFRELR
jgi:tetratricopeptide (TPR) repeat protein